MKYQSRLTPVQVERIKKMITFLRALPPEQFDFGQIRIYKDVLKENGYTYDKEHSCGMVGCIGGWMPNVFPEIFDQRRELGLDLTPEATKGILKEVGEDDLWFEGHSSLYKAASYLVGSLMDYGYEARRCIFYPDEGRYFNEQLDLPREATSAQAADMLEKLIELYSPLQTDTELQPLQK